MGKLFANVIESIGRFFIALAHILDMDTPEQLLLFKKNTRQEEKDDHFEYTFFFYMVTGIFLLYYFIEKFQFHQSSDSRLVSILNGISEIESEKYLIVSCIVLLLSVNLLAYITTDTVMQKSVVTSFSIYIFSTQLSVWFVAGVIGIIINYTGLTADDAGFFKVLVLFVITILFLLYGIGCVFVVPFSAIENGMKRAIIDAATARKLKWFVFVPIIITVIVRFIIPFRESRNDFTLTFIDSEEKQTALLSIDSSGTDDLRMSTRFMLNNNTGKTCYIEPGNAFYIYYLIYMDQNGNEKFDSIERLYEDTITLSTQPLPEVLVVKSDEPLYFKVSAQLAKKKYTELLYVLQNSKGKTLDFKMRILTDGVSTVYSDRVTIKVNGIPVKL